MFYGQWKEKRICSKAGVHAQKTTLDHLIQADRLLGMCARRGVEGRETKNK